MALQLTTHQQRCIIHHAEQAEQHLRAIERLVCDTAWLLPLAVEQLQTHLQQFEQLLDHIELVQSTPEEDAQAC